MDLTWYRYPARIETFRRSTVFSFQAFSGILVFENSSDLLGISFSLVVRLRGREGAAKNQLFRYPDTIVNSYEFQRNIRFGKLSAILASLFSKQDSSSNHRMERPEFLTMLKGGMYTWLPFFPWRTITGRCRAGKFRSNINDVCGQPMEQYAQTR